MAKGHSRIFKPSRLDITMNNLDIQYVGDYQIFGLLGKGSFAKVFKARKKDSDKEYVNFFNLISRL